MLRCGFPIGSRSLILNYCGKRGCKFTSYKRISLPPPLASQTTLTVEDDGVLLNASDPNFLLPGTCVCVCVCAQTTNWFELRANIYTEWVAVQLCCAAQIFLWFAWICFACRSQSSVLPFLCSLIKNEPLTECISAAQHQRALDCYMKLVMNDSWPVTCKRDTHVNERRQRISQSEMPQTGWDSASFYG